MVRHPREPVVRLPVEGVLLDLLMAVMDSMAVWAAAAGGRGRGLRWRDAVSARMIASARYTPYEDLVAEAASAMGIPGSAVTGLFEGWRTMTPWPDAQAIASLKAPFALVTNSSQALAELAAERSGLRPQFVLSAEEAGWYKPDARVYRLACRRLGIPAGRALFVAGSAYDAVGARDAGLQNAFVARRPDQRVPEPVPVVGSLADVVAAIDR
jgi:2-haloalkanoic acid dehalogenase type II